MNNQVENASEIQLNRSEDVSNNQFENIQSNQPDNVQPINYQIISNIDNENKKEIEIDYDNNNTLDR